ncbi:MAG: tetratricopeptide repeat protein [Sedimentisphaerales bacterium]|jgi:tetratricopeptide (TPR) repeat protein
MQNFVDYFRSSAFLILLLFADANSSVHVLSELNQFDKAPEFALPKLTSPAETLDLQTIDRPTILIFGEPYNQQTLESLVKLKRIVDAVGLAEADLRVFLIVSNTPDQQQLTQLHEEGKISEEILLDKNLKAFGDYGITVLPSTIVIDKQGRIDLALSGVPLSFTDMVEDAILLATERITRQQFESSRSAAQQTNVQQESVKRAHRLAGLARQLARRDYTKLALKRYNEALELDNTYAEARIGVARCLIKLNLLPDAIEELQKILRSNAEDVEANLVMSQIEIIQGGDGIMEGKQRLRRILATNPNHPEANYLMGMACEAEGENDHALNYYKKAAKRLLETSTN